MSLEAGRIDSNNEWVKDRKSEFKKIELNNELNCLRNCRRVWYEKFYNFGSKWHVHPG